MMNEQDPNDIRAQLLASLQERMAPVAAPDTSAQEAAAADARNQAMMIRSGVQLGQAFLGNGKSDGANLYSESLEGGAKDQLAKAMEAKRLAAEQDKRRDELRNGLSTRFVDDENLRARTKESNDFKTSEAKLKREQDEADQAKLFAHQKELANLNNAGKASLAELKHENKADKPIESKLLADKSAMDNTISLLNTIKILKNGENGKGGIKTGKVSNFSNAMGQMVNMDDPQVSGFKAMVGTQLADYIKSISGAAVSDTERAFLIKNVPSMEDSDETFNQKLDDVTKLLETKRGLFLDNLEASGRPNVGNLRQVGPQSVTAPTQAPATGDVSAKQKRLEELRAKKAAAGK